MILSRTGSISLLTLKVTGGSQALMVFTILWHWTVKKKVVTQATVTNRPLDYDDIIWLCRE